MSNTVVNTNVLAINSQRSLKAVGGMQAKASAKLSSGLRINSAADDAAGLAISEKMRGQIRGLNQASRNAQDGISLIQTAEGGMQEIDNMLQRIRELVVQAANDTNDFDTDDREKIQNEINQLLTEINSMASRVEFNAKKLLSDTSSVTFQVGANAGQTMTVKLTTINTEKLDLDGKVNVNVAKATAISQVISTVNKALMVVTAERAKLGAAQNRLEFTINSLEISSENLQASESRIRDTDMAKEMMNVTKGNVLQQAATSMLAQANQAPQRVLQLLQ